MKLRGLKVLLSYGNGNGCGDGDGYGLVYDYGDGYGRKTDNGMEVLYDEN